MINFALFQNQIGHLISKMNQQHQQQMLYFFEKMTRRLADTFLEINQLCNQQLHHLQRPSSPIQQIPHPVEIPFQPIINAAIQLDSSEQMAVKQPPKTKQIKKQYLANEDQKDEDTKAKRKVKKASHKPKAPASSFLLFFKDQQNNMAQTYPNYGVTQLTKVAAKLWKDLSKEEKEPYIKLCDEERKLYQQKMEKYRIEFPHEIAQKEKDKRLLKKQKKNNPEKGTRGKQRVESDLKSKASLAEQDAQKVVQSQREIVAEEIIDSEQFMKGDMSDSLGLI